MAVTYFSTLSLEVRMWTRCACSLNTCRLVLVARQPEEMLARWWELDDIPLYPSPMVGRADTERSRPCRGKHRKHEQDVQATGGPRELPPGSLQAPSSISFLTLAIFCQLPSVPDTDARERFQAELSTQFCVFVWHHTCFNSLLLPCLSEHETRLDIPPQPHPGVKSNNRKLIAASKVKVERQWFFSIFLSFSFSTVI